MNSEKDFLIPFVGLKLGKHHYDFHINKEFIFGFGYDDFEDINVNVSLFLEKKATFLELVFSHKGFVTVPSDSTGDIFDLPIEGDFKLIVKFGEEFNNDNEELLIIPPTDFQVDVKQYIYEMIVLSIPTKRIHPEDENFENSEDDFDTLDFLDDEDLDLFESMNDDEEKTFDDSTEGESEDIEDKEKIDPRWEKLKQLLTDK